MWDKLLKFLNDNKDALDILLGSGLVLAFLGALYKLVAFAFKQIRLRKTRSSEDFPFKIIAPGQNVSKEILGGNDNDFFADRNIPYQQRAAGRNVRLEIENLLDQNHWLLITGRTGLGKTREAVNVVESLSKEGWTVLYLTRDRWLSAPSKLPPGVPERKLLFFLDDLNRKMYASRVEQSPRSAENVLSPLNVPLQDRLRETLTTFEALCGKSEIRVIATARDEKFKEFADEPSEWDKLEISKYDEFWKKFTFYPLSEAEDEAEINLLKDVTRIADVKAIPTDFPLIAKKNDGTFSNLIENIRTANNQVISLQADTFRDTLRGTWSHRYQQAVDRHRFARYVYDSVELIRAAGLDLTFLNVFYVTTLLPKNVVERYNLIRNLMTLQHLIKRENILDPRDGQIEAKGYKLEVEEYLPLLSKIISVKFISSLSIKDKINFGIAQLLYTFLLPLPVLAASQKISFSDRFFNPFFELGSLLNNLAIFYQAEGFVRYAEQLNRKSLILKDRSLFRRFRRKSRARTWSNQGNVYRYQNQHEAAVQAYQKAIELNPKLAGPWYGLGVVYYLQKETEKALSAFLKASDLIPKNGQCRSTIIGVLKKLGRYAEASEQVNVARPLVENENEYSRACFEAVCGNAEEAFRLLKIALEKKQFPIHWVRQDPNFDSLREDPRFKELVGLE